MSIKSHSSENRINYWQNHISNWQESKLTQSDYCKEHNLNRDLFSRWKTRLLKTNLPLVEIPQKTNTPSNHYLELIIHDQIKIRLENGYDTNLLLSLLKSLGIDLC